MKSLSFSGYGFDITDFDRTVLTPAEHQLFDQLVDSDSIIDAADELRDHSIYDDIAIGTPCNNDDFELFIYLPDQTVVGVNAKTIKCYTCHDADQRLTRYFNTFMHDLDSMEHTHLDKHHTDVFLSMLHKLSDQIDNEDQSLPDWRAYSDYC